MSDIYSLSVDDFARHVARSNPFAQDRVTQAQSLHDDVTSIHQKPFKRLLKRIEEVRASGSTTGVLLTGPAGVGKSHLLSRLFRWAGAEGKATVVYLHNILCSPERTGRYLLHATVNALAGYNPAAFADSELYKLINLAIGARLEQQGWKSRGLAPNLGVRKEILHMIGQEIDPDQLVMPVFIAYLEQAVGAHLAEDNAEERALGALRWLSGEAIDADVAERIGLHVNSEDGACIEDDVAVQRVLDVMCRLCALANRPFVLCLDQVDNLSDVRVRALTSFLHATIDNGSNLVVITSGVRASLERLKLEQVIPTAAYDRVAQHEIQLQTIAAADAHAIVASRANVFCRGFESVSEVKAARKVDELFPLNEAWWKKRMGKLIETRPRDVIRFARDAWEDVQESLDELGVEVWLKQFKNKAEQQERPKSPLVPLEKRIDALVALKIEEARNVRALNPARLPPDADNLATLTQTLLELCIGQEGYTVNKVERVETRSKASTYDLWVSEIAPHGEQISNGLTFFTADNALSATNALKRLAQAEPPPTHQIFITDEERRPIRLAAKGREVYEKLQTSPYFEHIALTFADHAQLDAISTVVGAARVGDLDVEVEHGSYRALSEEECRASLHRQGVFLKHPLLRELLTEEERPPVASSALSKLQQDQLQHHIKGELVMALSMTAREMATIIMNRTGIAADQFEVIWEKVKVVANKMHRENELFVDAVDDDLFLQLAHVSLNPKQ